MHHSQTPRSDTPITALRNLGPKSAQWLRDAGITTFGDLQQRGAVRAYLAVKSHEGKASLNLLYAIAATLENRHWNDLQREEKLRLQVELDALADALREA